MAARVVGRWEARTKIMVAWVEGVVYNLRVQAHLKAELGQI